MNDFCQEFQNTPPFYTTIRQKSILFKINRGEIGHWLTDFNPYLIVDFLKIPFIKDSIVL